MQALSCLQVLIAILWFVFLNVLNLYEHLSLQTYTSFLCFMVWFKKKLSIPFGEASSSWILSALVVAIEKQSNRVSAIGACLAYVIDLELNIS